MTIRISNELNIILNFAREEAMRTGCYAISPDHLCLALIRHSDNIACETLRLAGVDLVELKKFLDSKLFTDEHIPYSSLEKISFSRAAHNLLSFTILEATKQKSDEATSLHLILALSRSSGNFSQKYFSEIGVNYRVLSEQSYALLKEKEEENEDILSDEEKNEITFMEISHEAEDGEEKPAPASFLSQFAHDLTKSAEDGLLDPLIGRENEIARVIQILGRRRKNSALLIGEPGVGKSAIIEGIADRIAHKNVPACLADKRVYSIDIASLVAGTRYRGDFEDRLRNVIREVKDRKNIILFIDEFHNLVGAGNAQGSLDAANILKPFIARGEIQCIGASTIKEYTQFIEKDAALDRRFQTVHIEEADTDYTIEILQKLRERYEEYHGVKYSDEAIEACARLSDRYINDRRLPDKAIDVMDEAGSMIRIKGRTKEVSADDIAKIISLMTGIPSGRIAEGENRKLQKMESALKSRIIGQDEAVDSIVRAIHRSRAGVSNPDRPIGSFLFVGPTGVGKTQLAKAIAEYLFDSEDNIIRVDMNEYSEKISSTRLAGAPPGYVGFEDGGELSERVRKKPYSVVLLDEIEKAHPDIFNNLLQILDEGMLTDNKGRKVNFRNTIIIMTSNAGSRELDDFGDGLGFATSARTLQDKKESILNKAIRKIFPPEFINRIDEIISFNELSRENLSKIIDIEIKDLRKRLLQAGFKLSISNAAKNYIAEAGYDRKYGARPLKKAIRKHIEDPVSEFIIADKIACSLSKRKDTETRCIRIDLSKKKEGLEIS